ncbi:MAG: triose-phosphate isomerase [Candidatus Omnitrophica bacterium]|nr:triose-phosphate isomerase [Candidatus Omnitrophota bacterium]MCB9721152.1 triose-phosphate isomerase [Candidatus Omnitrophota bacterium]
MRKSIIAGNWKLNKTCKEAVELVTELNRELSETTEVDVVVCPPFTALRDISDVLVDSKIGLGAQNLYWEDSGAFTGEISAPMIKDAGAQYVIIGHSERRQFFGETDETVNKKIRAALAHELTPIVCVGEMLEDREAGRTEEVIKTQFSGSFAGLSAEEMEKLVIAYEPVWAIGTGKTATKEQAQEVHQLIRQLLTAAHGESTAESIRIQYGGSVKPDNIAELIAQPDIDGALVGGASLKSDSFTQIVKNSLGVAK